LSVKELTEIFEVREVIQGVSVKNVIEKSTEKEIKELESYFLPFAKEEIIDEEQYYNADKKFHRRLIELSHNDLIIKINKMFNIHNFSYQEGLVRPPQETLTEHLNLIKAIKNREKDRAQILAIEHIAKSCDNIFEELLKNN
jgi:DNA-binding GntR family transcriptional regulator